MSFARKLGVLFALIWPFLAGLASWYAVVHWGVR